MCVVTLATGRNRMVMMTSAEVIPNDSGYD